MRLSTSQIDIWDYLSHYIDDLDDIKRQVSFNYDFIGVESKQEAEKLILSDGDIQVLVELYASGIHSGEQEYIHSDDNGQETSYRLIWQLA